MFQPIFTWLLNTLSALNYFNITVLMAVESSFLPLPSELILPPAGYLASLGKLNMGGIILVGTLGSLIGATFNYVLAYSLGRKVLHRLARSKWAKWFLINEEKLIHAEEYYKTKGKLATFIGRLLPVVRHLISLPAGLAKMNIWHFWFFTALGAALWTTVLTLLGYWFGANKEMLAKYYHQIWIAGIIIIIGSLIYIIIKNVCKKK